MNEAFTRHLQRLGRVEYVLGDMRKAMQRLWIRLAQDREAEKKS